MSVPDGLAMPGAKAFPTLESILGPMLIGTLLSAAYVKFVNPVHVPTLLA
jgi:hypothetical protein